MREILFRGKRLDNGDWAEGYLVKFPYAIQIGSDYSPWYIIVPPKDPDDHGGRENVDHATVGQYTGLTDKNGIKVFEGDIVHLDEDVKTAFRVSDGEVIYCRGGFHIGTCDLLRSLNAIASYDWVLRGEVIGNIHDNPELLKEERLS